ncbi:MAG: guanylate kinase [Dehalococcoidia bacterium]|nr:guanylate kinase [Dehalococcoidia bacterium]
MLSRVPRTPLVVVLSGPSGVGKDAMLNHMRLIGAPYHFTVTATTRPMRSSEKHGVDYIFISPDEFVKMKEEGEFLESAEVYGNWYGVPKPQVRQALQNGLDVIIKTDVQGAATIKRMAPQVILVFVAPPSMHELERRLRWRLTESDESLRIRVETARLEMEQMSAFDYLVVNDNLDDAIKELQAIISAEKCRLPPRLVRI